MPRDRRAVNLSLEKSPKSKRRKRFAIDSVKRNLAPSESLLWPDVDESFFSNSRLESLLPPPTNAGESGQDLSINLEQTLLPPTCFRNCVSTESAAAQTPITDASTVVVASGESFFHDDDHLFCDIELPAPSEGARTTPEANVSATLLTQRFPSDLEEHNSFFSELLLDAATGTAQDEELFLPAEDIVQNTQKFLEDLSVFKAPQVPSVGPTEEASPPPLPIIGNAVQSTETQSILSVWQGTQASKKSRGIEGLVQGSQYQTRQELQALEQKEIADLSDLNWETQMFPVPEEEFPSKGCFYGLPTRVRRLIFEHKGIKSLYEWQNECLNLPAVGRRKNLIYALPTSGGKTLVAEILMLREILCRQRNVLFLLPYVSIVQEKVAAMSPFAIALDFFVDEYTAGKGKCPPVARSKRKSIFIASIEKGAVLMDSLIDAKREKEIGLVVVDELHLIGEKGRGATLEALLAKIMFLKANIQIVGMSATIGNLTEISAFLDADVYTRGFRPVELTEYIKCGKDILELNPMGGTLEEVFMYRRSVNFRYSDAVARADPDHLAGLVAECAPENSCLVFCSTRKNCENVATLLCRILPKTKFVEHRKSEKADLMDALDKVCGILSPVLAKTIPYGVAYHHSGLTTDERKFIETAYRFGVLSVICCTSTLAAGVNLPAKRVIIRAPYVGNEFLNLCRYKQMVGRAGRAGLGEAGESILICPVRENARVGEMLFSPMDKAISSLDYRDNVGLQGLILSAIGLAMANCRRDLYALINGTLLAVQAEYLGISTKDLILSILRDMFKHRVLEVCTENTPNCSSILVTQDLKEEEEPKTEKDSRIYVSKKTRFKLTTIGRAAFKAGIDYRRAYFVHNELRTAQRQLMLSNYAHLLYLVVCFNSNENGDELFAADASILFRAYGGLDEATQSFCKLLGFTEALAAKLAITMSIQGPMELKLNRLYKVLILLDILNVLPIPQVAAKYNIERGMVQNLIGQCTSASGAIVRLCEQIEEFWCFKPLFERVGLKMDRCGTLELEALLDLPAVKINRAKQLYSAGFKTIEDIAKARPIDLVHGVAHMSLRGAMEIVSAAKIMLMKKLDNLEEETAALKMCLRTSEN